MGSKLLFWLEDPQLAWHSFHNPAYLIGGKTIVGALAGGLIAVELIKRCMGLSQSTGDLYAIPLALGIAVGRVGCFLTGLADNTCGTPTRFPWGIDFGDGIPRHPTQLYEMAFLLLLVPFLYRVVIRSARVGTRPWEIFLPGDAFRFFMVAYMLFRLVCDFIKPYPRIFIGLGGIQWACLLVLLYYSRDIARWLTGVSREMVQ